jgi:hypothetical protein
MSARRTLRLPAKTRATRHSPGRLAPIGRRMDAAPLAPDP